MEERERHYIIKAFSFIPTINNKKHCLFFCFGCFFHFHHKPKTMSTNPTHNPNTTIFEITVKDAKGNDVDLSIYKGKVLLIVNVASQCGLTSSNYTELNQLYEKYKDQGFEILAFPCNQFGDQEPGSREEINDLVCTHFKSEFPIFDKIDVNGDNAAPIYKFLKSGNWGVFANDIQWNFSKFLINRDGKVTDRFYPSTSPLCLEQSIKKLLGEGSNEYLNDT